MFLDALASSLDHRTVRHFQARPVEPSVLDQLLDVAQHTATSHFLQAFSVIRITDPALRQQIAAISTQAYVNGHGELLLFVADQHRAATLATAPDLHELGSADKFLQSVEDATLAVQNVVGAAERLGLGTVILGSVLNDAQALIDLLHLPALTFPLLGLIIGYPAQATEPKPRMPRRLMTFENHYALDPQDPAIAAYDQTIATYYATRATNQRAETFSHLLTHSATTSPAHRGQLLAVLHAQGFLQEAR
ncbi:nitroreductase family protein [Lacticaseibacillus absianus]|uniref:nitroreductase family protein n=1 Tax=Lacticaseibacillus absianus TaxID=2729623 RepID=UPI0015C74FAC|nr:nitroreductase family protein [Lacticaseibacillus absianus]